MTNNSKNIQLLMKLLTEFAKGEYNSDRKLKVHHIYGTRGITYSFQVGIYIWPLPFLFTTLMYVETYRNQPEIEIQFLNYLK